mgnify:CR=1 FL=1
MANLEPKFAKLAGTEKFTRLLSGVPATAGMKSGYVTLKPGEAVGEHKTASREEAIIILEGQAAVYCEQKFLFTAAAQSLVYIPPEMNHDIRNEGSVPLRYVYVVTPVEGNCL